MTDTNIRALQRRADAGDPEAMVQLARETLRALDVIEVVSRLSVEIHASAVA